MTSRLALNVLSNMAQTLIGSALLFTLYRFINANLGIEKLGVWTVVLSTVSISRLIDLGLSAGVTRFVARDRSRGNFHNSSHVIDTSFLTLMTVVGFFLPILYLVIKLVLPNFLMGENLAEAISVLPFALVSLWLTVGAAVFLAAIAGCERMDLQAGLVVFGQALLLLLAITLVPKYGFKGLAYAQIVQSIFTLSASRMLLCAVHPELPRIPHSWNKSVFRELLNYGANVQAASVAMIVFETTTKLMMARFGGAAAVGYFEMVNQLVIKVRAVIVTANQAIVPHVAALSEREPESLQKLNRDNLRLIAFFVCPIFALLFCWAGGFSWLLAGGYQPQFATFLWLVGSAWLLNIFSVPAYLMNMGTGNVKWNTLSHVFTAIINIVIGWTLGEYLGALGIAISYAASISMGAIVILYTYRPPASNTQPLKAADSCMWFRENIFLVFGCIILSFFAWWSPMHVEKSTNANLFLSILLPSVFLAALMWIHPLRRELITLISHIFFRKRV